MLSDGNTVKYLIVALVSCYAVLTCESAQDNTSGSCQLSNIINSDEPSPVNNSVASNLDCSGESQIVPNNVQRLVQSTTGARAGSNRYHLGDGYYYHHQRVGSGRVYLRCALYRSNPSCHVRAVMNVDRSNFQITAGVHNHGPDVMFDRVVQLRESLLEACRVRPNVRVELLYHDVCRNVHRDVSTRVSLLSMRPSMVRVQSEHRPNIPHTFDDLAPLLANNVELGRTLDAEAELYRGMTGAEGHRSIIFTSTRVIQGVGGIRHLFCDGTFYARPNSPDSAQLYTMVTVRDNHVIPVLHALMEARSAQAYRDLFAFVRNLVPTLDPDFIMTDFEQAQQTMLHEAFPRARLSGCLWHYARAACRNVRNLGLHALVRDNQNAQRIVRLSMAIPLAPPGRLQEALNSIVVEARRLMVFDQMADYFNYIRTTWINGVGDAALSVFGVRHRTNNVAECHHRNMNARLVRRPNIWRFLEMLREGEDQAWRDLGRLEQGFAPSRARRVSSLLGDARIRSLSRQVMHREMDMLHFLACVSYRLEGTLRDFLNERPDQDRPASPPRGPHPQQSEWNVSGRLCESREGRQMDVDFQAHSGDSQELDMAPLHGSNRRSSVDDSDFYESLMEDVNEDPDDPPIPSRGRGSRARRGARGSSRARGARRGRGANAAPVAPARGGSARGGSARGGSARGGSARGGSARGGSARGGAAHGSNSANLGAMCRSVNGAWPRVEADVPRVEVNLRPEDFSDEELIDDSIDQNDRRWTECIICNSRVGHYAMIFCGAFPLCGSCLHHWFVVLRRRACLHCGGQVHGWLKVNH